MDQEEGTRCDEANCGIIDLLPFQCPQCEGKFCVQHRSRFIHTCEEKILNSNLNANKQVSSSAAGSDTATLNYKKKIESVTSRFDHDASHIGDSKSHFAIKSSHDPVVSTEEERVSKKVEKLSSLESTSKSASSNAIAKKTKEMLIAKNAKGNASIAGRDRFYLIVRCPETEKELHLFFPITIILGEMLNQIANIHPLLIFGTVTRPPEKSLRLYTDDTPSWTDWNMNICVSKVLTSFESVNIISVDTNEAVEAQAALLYRLANPSTATATATATATDTTADNSQVPVESEAVQHTFEIGSLALYKTSSGTLETVRIIAAHKDDFPNVYYTIRQPSGNERQTDSNRLTPRSSAGKTTTINTNKANAASITGVSLSSEVFDPESFPVLISYQGKVYTVNGVLADQPVTKLHTLVADQISPLLSAPIFMNKVSIKLIYKGKILHVSENLRVHKLTRNSKLTLIVSNLK